MDTSPNRSEQISKQEVLMYGHFDQIQKNHKEGQEFRNDHGSGIYLCNIDQPVS